MNAGVQWLCLNTGSPTLHLSISYVSRESSRPSVGMSVRLTSITFPSWINFHLCKVFCDLKVIVLKSYLKWWKVNSDKTEFRFEGKNKILKLILQYRLWHMLNHWMLSGKFEGSEIRHGIFWGSIFCPGNFWVLLEALRPPPPPYSITPSLEIRSTSCDLWAKYQDPRFSIKIPKELLVILLLGKRASPKDSLLPHMI